MILSSPASFILIIKITKSHQIQLSSSNYGPGGGGGGQNNGYYNSSNYNDNHKNRNKATGPNAMGGRGSGRGRGMAPPQKNNPSNVVLGTNTTREVARSLSVQSENTYDANANITIAIDDTIPLNGMVIPELSISSSSFSSTISHHTDGSAVVEINNVRINNVQMNDTELNKNDPFGVGLTEKEMTHVTTENKLILIEVRIRCCSIPIYCLLVYWLFYAMIPNLL